ncbi:hypothetical protein PC118_g22439 [Phytophthora cactorum]|uniref:Uncharacterized protein n=1 Tax=Phytophthora cactorum TaxID=29920 RepID=A0A8T1ETC2_9STRA|nr:hypothetical protein PC118_g22439 [Phytophthora cactorum]
MLIGFKDAPGPPLLNGGKLVAQIVLQPPHDVQPKVTPHFPICKHRWVQTILRLHPWYSSWETLRIRRGG